MCINTVVILLGDVIRDKQKWRGARFERSLWEPEAEPEPEVLKVHEFLTEPLSMVFGG